MSKTDFHIAVLASGRGSNLQALLNAQTQGILSAKVCVVLTDQPKAQALTRALDHQIPTLVVEGTKGESRDVYAQKLIQALTPYNLDLIVLAGFMKIISPFFLNHFDHRVINIHPSLLPAFPGLHAQKQALDYGVKWSGCTVHFVDDGCDTGPIILQAVVPVLQDDTEETLAQRILVQEHQLLPKAIDLIAKNKVNLTGRHVTLEE